MRRNDRLQTRWEEARREKCLEEQWRRVGVPFGKLSLLVTGALECSLALLARNLLMAFQSFVPEIIHKHV